MDPKNPHWMPDLFHLTERMMASNDICSDLDAIAAEYDRTQLDRFITPEDVLFLKNLRCTW